MNQTAPLAYRLRPKSLDDFVGQEHILAPGTPLRQAIEADRLTSVILAGPPGTGKTTLAHIIAQQTQAQFVTLNAVTSGVKDIKEVCSEAEQIRTTLRQRTVLFIDEIHRFNKAQQDALLPYVESGAIILIGATTENPYFEVNSALISRSQVHLLRPLTEDDLFAILKRATKHPDGIDKKVTITDDALRVLATIANGDARIGLNALETTVLTVGNKITKEEAQRVLAERARRYDKRGEDHYDTISAFIKTMRGSDVDAALIWLYKMILSGEEPRFIFRRLAIFASEDIGNADPRALQIVMSAWQAFEFVGLPEGEFFLAHACTYLAQAPKSNAITTAMYKAKDIVQQAATVEVPYHLRNAPAKGMKEQGYGKGYQYPHNSDGAVVREDYFPIGQQPAAFYQPSDRGEEAAIRERWNRTKKIIDGEIQRK